MKKEKDSAIMHIKQELPDVFDEDTEIVIDERCKQKRQKKGRKPRLIVRNLSFKATEEKLREFFSPYGDIRDIQVLRKPNGQLVGCCFVEYTTMTSAAKAIAHVSGKPFLSRPVVVDWAVAKDKFVQKSDPVKSEFDHEDDKSKILDEIKVKEEGTEANLEDNESSDEEGSQGSDEGHPDAEEDSESDDGMNKFKSDSLQRRKPLRESHDLSEGCTVFVKNLPFSVENEDLKECMKKYGKLYYALVCMDPLTEHSKGTGFVKFTTKEAAASCIAAGKRGEVTLSDRVVEVLPAVNREDVHKESKNLNSKKDNRNLYLIKEGVILAGSAAAHGVSASDMAKRLQLEQWKTQMLRNLNKFVSRNRLVIHNLPASYDDQKLKALCLKHGGTKPFITEARVMRNLKDVDANGRGRSKEFGFVTFAMHENALHALRALNNNPDIFTPNKRPIVAFSIEDKKIINLRQKRIERSRAGLRKKQDNARPQGDIENKGGRERQIKKSVVKGANRDQAGAISQKEWEKQRRETKQISKPSKGTKRKFESGKTDVIQKKKHKLNSIEEKDQSSEYGASFMGEVAKEGRTSGMTKSKLRVLAETHSKSLKLKNKKMRKKKQSGSIKIKQPKQPKGKEKELKPDTFSKLVNKYKTQLSSHEVERKKWYDT